MQVEKLLCWNKSISLTKEVYQVITNFPEEEKYGLISQLRRATVSVAANIAEGRGRNSSKEFKHFLGISYGSLMEVETLIIIAHEVKLLTPQKRNDLLNLSRETGRLINGLKKSLS